MIKKFKNLSKEVFISKGWDLHLSKLNDPEELLEFLSINEKYLNFNEKSILFTYGSILDIFLKNNLHLSQTRD